MTRITKATRARAQSAEKALVRAGKRTRDSFQNFGLNLGQGTDNALSGSTYGFNPISRNRTLLEWIHRGSWMGGVAVDTVAEDMTRAGIDIVCDNPPEEVHEIQELMTTLSVWPSITDTCKWSRLYGGSIGVMMVDGQNVSTPLDPDKVGREQFRGVLPMDRWMVEPSLNDLVTEQGPHIGMPKFYSTASNTSGYRFEKIHYTRVIRLEGIRLPYWQRVSENLWGISVLERLYDRMVAFDSATTGTAQMAYKSHVRTYKIEGLREIIGIGGEALKTIYEYVDMMRRFQGIEGITLIDSKDELAVMAPANMTGMSEALLQFGQQLAGALGIPLVRLFGQSPAGLNSTGESDLRTYYDGIAQQQASNLLVPLKSIVKMSALSLGIKLKDDFTVVFRPLWQLSEEQKSEVSARDTESILKAEERGVITQQTALQELKTQSKTTGRFSNITDEDVEAASDELAPRGEEALQQQMDLADAQGGDDDQSDNDPKEPKPPKSAKDALHSNSQCFCCGKKLGMSQPKEVWTSDPQMQWVGPECYTLIKNAGEQGYQPPRGGPRLYVKQPKDADRPHTSSRNAQIVHCSVGEPSGPALCGNSNYYASASPDEFREAASRQRRPGESYLCRNCARKLGLTVRDGAELPARSRDSLPVSQWMGLDVGIETLRGHVRRGADWEAVQPADYGYIRRMPSAEGPTEWMDCYLSADRVQGDAYVVDGYEPGGAFDEHKVMLGYADRQSALRDFHAAYGDGRRAGGVTPMSVDRLRAWMESGDVTRPLADRNLRLAANG